jgi:photosystem II stability/assembly factor-like uncharacterized protein
MKLMNNVKKKNVAVIRSFCIVLFLSCICIGQTRWEWCAPLPQGNTILSMAYGHQTFVAVGEYGTILTSKNGTTWTTQKTNTTKTLQSIIFSRSNFFAVGDSGIALKSSDGVNWIVISSGTTRNITAIESCDSLIIAFADSGVVIQGYDNNSKWRSSQLSWIKPVIRDLISQDSQFIAVGDDGIILTSKDGIYWDDNRVTSTDELKTIIYFNNQFIIGADYGMLFFSNDGINWTTKYCGYSDYLNSMIVCNNKIFAAASNNTILTSDDGLQWSKFKVKQNETYSLNTIVHGNNIMVAAGSSGLTVSSNDLSNWNLQIHSEFDNLCALAFGNNRFVAINRNCIGISEDGKNWTKKEFDTTYFFITVNFCNNQFIVSGASGEILTSLDGVDWTKHQTPFDEEHYDAAYNGNTYVIVGDGNVITSTNGSDWTTTSTKPTVNRMVAVASGNGVFIGGDFNDLFRSTDGINWTKIDTLPRYVYLASIVFGLNKFIVVCDSGKIFYSSDGSNWIKCTTPTKKDLNKIIFVNNRFYVIGHDGTLLISDDGIVWIEQPGGSYQYYSSIAYGNGKFIIIGSGGTILSSDNDNRTTAKQFSKIKTSGNMQVPIVNNMITISLPEYIKGDFISADLYFLSGKKILSKKFKTCEGRISISKNNIANGIYVAIISDQFKNSFNATFMLN